MTHNPTIIIVSWWDGLTRHTHPCRDGAHAQRLAAQLAARSDALVGRSLHPIRLIPAPLAAIMETLRAEGETRQCPHQKNAKEALARLCVRCCAGLVANETGGQEYALD